MAGVARVVWQDAAVIRDPQRVLSHRGDHDRIVRPIGCCRAQLLEHLFIRLNHENTEQIHRPLVGHNRSWSNHGHSNLR